MRTRSPASGYTLTETVIVLGLILLGVLALVAGARTWLAAQRTDQALTTLDAVVAAEELTYGRFASFTADPSELSTTLQDVALVATSTAADEAVVVVGAYTDVTYGTTTAVAVGVADGPTCHWVRVPDLQVRVDRAAGSFTGVCDSVSLADATQVWP